MKKIDDDVVWIISTVSACSFMAYFTIVMYCFFGAVATGIAATIFALTWAIVHHCMGLASKELEADES